MEKQRQKRAVLSRFREWIGELLFPHAAVCLCCGAELRYVSEKDCLCDACRAGIRASSVPAEACDRCLSRIPQGKKCRLCASPEMKDIERVFSPFMYRAEVRQLIHAFKFDACSEALVTLGDSMAQSLSDRDFDYLVPVPLHRIRLRERGVNQSAILAQALSEQTGIPVAEPLERPVYRKPQSALRDSSRRKGNVQNVFACKQDLSGSKLLLIDDVRTTGSTAAACAEVLRKAGAAKISLCTAAVVYK